MILVTGGTGLVGSHLAYDLLKKGYDVKILIRQTSDKGLLKRVFGYYDPGNSETLYSKIHWIQGDLTDRFSLDEALVDVDTVYHTAAKVSLQKKDSREVRRVNIKGTADLVDRCLDLKIQKFCFVSSVAALGVPVRESLIDETTFCKPGKDIGSYAFSKFSSEMEVWRGITEGLNAVIINPSVILGPGFWNSGSNSIFSFFAKGNLFYTSGITGFVDVRDLSSIMIQLVEKNILAQRFIISSENVSYRELSAMIASFFGKNAPKYFLPEIFAETLWMAGAVISLFSSWNPRITKNVVRAAYKKDLFSNEKIKKCLTFEFRPISETIRDLSQYYKKDFTTNG